MAATAQTKPVDRKVQLKEVLDWLVEDGLVPPERATKLLQDSKFQRGGSRHPVIVIAEQRWRSEKPPGQFLTGEALTEWLAGRMKMPFYHIDPLKIDLRAVTQVMSSEYAARRNILPVEVNGREVTIATAEPLVSSWEKELGEMLRLSIKRVLANPVDVERYQGEFFNLAKSMKKAEAAGVPSGPGIANFEQLVELGRAGRQLDANDHHIVHLVDWLWQYAFDQRASDIHLEPRRDVGILRFRIDGVLHQVYQVPYPVLTAMVARIKILGRMDVVEKRRPQDGRIKTRMPDGEEIELRLSSLPTAHGEKLVMRIFDPEVLMRDFKDLGFTQEEHELWQKLIREPGGILLVTGPTGSGKTTTLYSALTKLNEVAWNISTAEDPVEFNFFGINQVQMHEDIGLNFAAALRSFLRQDPDIIMVGEIRDGETAGMAIEASLTGHLVLSTLHTNDAPGTVSRLLNMGIEPFLVTASLNAIVAQRLCRKLCPDCKKPAQLDEQALLDAGVPAEEIGSFSPMDKGEGCKSCNGRGFKGRVAVYEVMPLWDGLKELVIQGCSAAELKQEAIRLGFKTLRMSALNKVKQGVTNLSEAVGNTAPDRF